jgi:alkyl sulfatase BDS1-like metallo-beta-lactamase superfamily hydrolase
MKLKIVIAVQAVVILLLACLVVVSQSVSFKSTKPVVREPLSPEESSLTYTPPPAPKSPVENLAKLGELRKAFTPKVTKVTDTIYSASGFALGSVHMVITDEGLVIFDTTESTESAKTILAEFRKITDKPIKYIVYTHGHVDHIYGSPAFMEPDTKVIATAAAVELMKKDFGWFAEFQSRSRKNQSGRISPEYSRKMPFKSPVRLPARARGNDFIWPTITFDKEYSFTLGGETFELYHTVGETPGHLMAWLPGEKALFCGDLYYLSFPNLSTPMLEPRDVRGWYESLDRMTVFQAEYLIPQHTRAIVGAEEVSDVLAHHSEAIRSVYDQTIKCINEGKSVDEAVQEVKLPDRLAQREHLQEVYGRVDWSVRGIYQREIGWYDGRGTGLNPLPPKFQARELVALAGGADKILARAIELQEAGEHQLAGELCDAVLDANPEDKLAHMIKASSLEYLAFTSGNMNMFGFYRSAAALEREAAGIKP